MEEVKRKGPVRKRKKATIVQLRKAKFPTYQFSGKWQDLVGNPEKGGVWCVWGLSSNGKTTFAIQLMKYFCEEFHLKCAYLSLEQGFCKSLNDALQRECMESVNRRVSLWQDMTFAEMREELKGKNAPKVVFIDSLQYLEFKWEEYTRLKNMFRQTIFVFISQAKDDRRPKGYLAQKLCFDADVKIEVNGFVAYASSRFGGGTPLTIWQEGAKWNAPDSDKQTVIGTMFKTE